MKKTLFVYYGTEKMPLDKCDRRIFFNDLEKLSCDLRGKFTTDIIRVFGAESLYTGIRVYNLFTWACLHHIEIKNWLERDFSITAEKVYCCCNFEVAIKRCSILQTNPYLGNTFYINPQKGFYSTIITYCPFCGKKL